MIDKGVLSSLLDRKKFAILKVLYFAREEMYLRELAKKSEVPVSSVFRIIPELTQAGLMRVKTIRMMKFYSLVQNEKSRFLDDWFKEENVIDAFVEQIRNIEGIKKVLLQGKISNNQANVIIIGSNIDGLKVDDLCNSMKEKGLDLSNVILTEDQFEKLDRMGVYGGEKKVLL